MQVAPGKVIAEKYRITSELGRGGMGSVWLAEHLTLGSAVAIKVIDAQVLADNPTVSKRFLQEAKAAAQLRSPHVVQIFDYGIDDGMPYIVMERLVGETLRHRLDAHGPLSPELCAVLFTHVGRAVQKAHEAGIIHRDLKPDNIFLVHNDDEIVAKVLDFGIAKAQRKDRGADRTTGTGMLLGSPLYMSPEQAHGAKELDPRSDLWSLAVIAFECMTGQVPFQGDGWGELIAKICRDDPPVPSDVYSVPEGFDEWFRRATEREPDQRFQTCREQVDQLRQLLTPESGNVRFVSSSPPVEQGTVAADGDTVKLPAEAGSLGASTTLRSTTGGVSATDPNQLATQRKRRSWLFVAAGAGILVSGFFLLNPRGRAGDVPREPAAGSSFSSASEELPLPSTVPEASAPAASSAAAVRTEPPASATAAASTLPKPNKGSEASQVSLAQKGKQHKKPTRDTHRTPASRTPVSKAAPPPKTKAPASAAQKPVIMPSASAASKEPLSDILNERE